MHGKTGSLQHWLHANVNIAFYLKTNTGLLFVLCDLDFWPFDPKINGFPGLMSMYLYTWLLAVPGPPLKCSVRPISPEERHCRVLKCNFVYWLWFVSSWLWSVLRGTVRWTRWQVEWFGVNSLVCYYTVTHKQVLKEFWRKATLTGWIFRGG